MIFDKLNQELDLYFPTKNNQITITFLTCLIFFSFWFYFIFFHFLASFSYSTSFILPFSSLKKKNTMCMFIFVQLSVQFKEIIYLGCNICVDSKLVV